MKPDALVFYLRNAHKNYDLEFSEIKSLLTPIFFLKHSGESSKFFDSNCDEIMIQDSQQMKARSQKKHFLKYPVFKEFSCQFST